MSLARVCPSCGHANPATAKFCSDCGVALPSPSAGVAPPAKPDIPEPAPQAQAERRHISVMFCDMVGSSALSTQMDAEANRDLISSFLSCCAAEITRLEGMVGAYLGDGVLAYFGYPTAHEDDAERAVRAGLEIIDAVRKLRPAEDLRLQCRIGIASGEVVIGDLVAGGVAQRNTVIGETANLASRLQTLAEPDTLVISTATYELVGGRFEYEDLGSHAVKGFAVPAHLRRVLRVSVEESRFEARNQEGVSQIFGRDEEIELIERRWDLACRGQGRLVLVTGEAGIGKSRIGHAMEERLRGQDYTCLTYHCSPYHRDSALHPIIGQINRVAGIGRADGTAEKLAKLEALLARSSSDLAEDVPLYASLLSIPHGEGVPAPDLTPQQLKSRTLDALFANLKGLCARRPVLLIFEDLQWMDATSLELLSLVVDGLAGLNLLILATARPEFTPPWPRYGHVSSTALGRLDNTEAVALVVGVAAGKPLGTELVAQIVERADGIPLYIEELTKTVLESGLLEQEGDELLLSGPMTSVDIPPTLRASLIARLDRLSSAKEVAQIGAAVGRQFSYGLMAAVSTAPASTLREALDRLVDAELIFERAASPEVIYEFKHALFRDATYASLIADDRRHLHKRIAGALEEHFPEVLANEPETPARHFAEAGDSDRAITLWQRAGERAISRCENKEALGHLRAALNQLSLLDDTAERDQREFQLQVARGAALMVAQGQSSPEVEQAYSRARSLATGVRDSEELFPALVGLWRYYAASGAQDDAHGVGELLQGLAARLGNNDLRIKACMTLGVTLYQQWRMPEAYDLLREGAELYESDPPEEHDAALSALGQHPGFMCAMGVAIIQWLRGESAEAVAWRDRSLAIGKRLSNPFQITIVHGWSAVLSYYRCDWDRLAEEVAVARDMAERHHVPVWVAITGVLSGFLQVRDGAVEEGLATCSHAVGEIDRLAYGTFRTRGLLILAQAHAMANRPADGLGAIDTAIDSYGAYGEIWIEPELHRVRGELLIKARAGRLQEALSAFRKAIEIARSIGLPTYERRAVLSLVRAELDDGDRPAAQAALGDLLHDWADDPLSAEWREAEALRREVSATPVGATA